MRAIGGNGRRAMMCGLYEGWIARVRRELVEARALRKRMIFGLMVTGEWCMVVLLRCREWL